MTAEEKFGVEMIQALQKVSGIDESDSDALNGWRSMSEGERETTRMVYGLLFAKREGARV